MEGTLALPLKTSNLLEVVNPQLMFKEAWDARYTYDADRRLLVPQYAGSRWGAVQQYKEEGVLEYQDWWIRDVRAEDLESSPDTVITSFLDEDGVLTNTIPRL